MRTSMQFKNFDGFEHLREFVLESVEHTLGKFESHRDFETQIILGAEKRMGDGHKPVFECEILLRGKGIHKPIVAKKKNIDFYQAVRSCLRASEKILRRTSRIRVSKRRRADTIGSMSPTLNTSAA
jgi:ribosome-associated translation inhibitor RaiA